MTQRDEGATPGVGGLVEESLSDLWRVVNRLSAAAPLPVRYRVSIFGSARLRPEHPVSLQVREVARLLAAAGCDIVTGGGPGLMQAANEGAAQGDPEDRITSYGLTVTLPHEERPNAFVEQLHHHATFFSRLHHFVQLSSAYVVFPGGIGTLLELMLVWQLLQVGHLPHHPLVLVGSEHWRGLKEWMGSTLVGHAPPLCNAADLELPHLVDTPAEAVGIVLAAHERWRAQQGGG